MGLENAQTAIRATLHADDTRLKTTEALRSLRAFDIKRAKQQLLDASEDIAAAHQPQTASSQAESNGEEVEHSILFTRAQDTYMTVYSEISIAQQLMGICEAIDERFKKLEKWNRNLWQSFLPRILKLEERYELL